MTDNANRDAVTNPAVPTPTSAPTAAEAPNPLLIPKAIRMPESIGPYKLLSVLGEGGFGIVYLAEQHEPIHRRVALKVIKPGMNSQAVISRFEQERQALAVMNHTNVAKVFDAGETPEGRPYFVMELVEGEPITDYCDRHTLTLRERLELFLPVCEAVHHAHQRGVIHRDLKPSNILVGVQNARPVPMVIDFGIAKAINHSVTNKSVFTEQGVIIGTPEYMSPEQAGMDALDIDTRTDVYSLGVVLYELLTGVLPFTSAELRSKGFHEINRIIREVEPQRPSARLSGMGEDRPVIARQRQSTAGELERMLRRELEWIPLRAMRKDRTQRYESPAELARDIANYLAGRPLLAGPESPAYRARKFVRKHRAAVTTGAIVLVSLVVATVFSARAAVQERAARTIAEVEREHAEETVRFLTDDVLLAADPEVGGPETRVAELLGPAAAAIPTRFAGRPQVGARVSRAIGEAYLALGIAPEAARMLEQALTLAGSTASPEFTTEVSARLGEAKYRLVQGSDAVALLDAALARAEAAWGSTDERTMDLRNQLGGALKHSGDLDRAEVVYTRVLADRTAAEGPSDVDALITRHNLNLIALQRARAKRRQGDEAGALAAMNAALAERRSITIDTRAALGEDHPQTLASRAEELGLLTESGEPARAAEEYPALLDSLRQRLGVGHWRTLESTARFGRALRMAGRADDAADQFTIALESYRFVRGPLGDTLAITDALAATLEAIGRFDRAEYLLKRAHEDVVRAEAGDIVCVRACALAKFYERRGNTDAATAARGSCTCP